MVLASLVTTSAAHASASLVECTDGGPWNCDEDGCPAPHVSCERLSSDGLCTLAFRDIFDVPPPDVADATVREACPQACGRCGLPPPGQCNMDKLDATALSSAELAEALVSSEAPILVEGAMAAWRETNEGCWVYPRLVAAHGTLPIKVITEGGRWRGEATEEVLMPMRAYPEALRNGSLSDTAYVFTDVQDELRCEEQFRAVPRTHAMRGRLILSMGSWGNGRPFHAHGPALFGLMAGVKRWFVRRPNASFAWQTYEVPRDDLRQSEPLPDGWAEQLWQCDQHDGSLLWVPDMLQHSTLNYAAETVGFAMVIDELHPPTPLHLAAQRGAAGELRALLRAGAEVDAPAAGGATALHHAAGLGHCDAAAALLKAGAAVGAVASKGGVTPLHVAAAGGHAAAAKLLLAHGALPHIPDQNGHSALDLAIRLGHEHVANVLNERHGRASELE